MQVEGWKSKFFLNLASRANLKKSYLTYILMELLHSYVQIEALDVYFTMNSYLTLIIPK